MVTVPGRAGRASLGGAVELGRRRAALSRRRSFRNELAPI